MTGSRPADADAAATVYRQRATAEGFGADAERYDRTRPSYPTAMIDRLVAASPGRDVLDVGTGTGTAARGFRDAGCTVVGVEPDARMAAVARARGFPVDVATFEQWDPDGRTFDLVVSAQAWHWIDPQLGPAKAATVLQPGGRLAVCWNAAQYPRPLREVYSTVLAGSVLAAAGRRESYTLFYDLAADGIERAGAFDAPQRWFADWAQTYSRDKWLDQVPSFGGHAALPTPRLEQLLTALGAAIDASGGHVTIEYTTGTVTALRRDLPGR